MCAHVCVGICKALEVSELQAGCQALRNGQARHTRIFEILYLQLTHCSCATATATASAALVAAAAVAAAVFACLLLAAVCRRFLFCSCMT